MSSDDTPRTAAWPGAVRSIGFMVVAFPVRVLVFVLLATGVITGLATAIVWLGLPILAAITALLPRMAERERRWIGLQLRIDIGAATPKPRQGTVTQRWMAGLTDPLTWRSLAYHLLMFPIGIAEFALGVAGVVLLPLALWVLPGLAWLHVQLARVMLGPSTTSELRAKAERLQASRARGVDAAEAERRRIERDLHDGAQQRLVAVAMGLGRAKSKMDSEDPSAARELINEAHADAKQAIAELRDLARGIYPSVLGDRGLDAALSALAAKSPVPVMVSAEIEPRPPIAVESTAYFIVGEALTNVAKHSDARSVTVRAYREADTVVAEITDDGSGGAVMRTGGGLAGLADRAATIDGVVTVFSPAGGPTVIRADLPCQW